jgi:hypothetical protein
MSNHHTTPQEERDAWRGIDMALALLGNWYEANEGDWEDDEETPLGHTMPEVRAMLDAGVALAGRWGQR